MTKKRAPTAFPRHRASSIDQTTTMVGHQLVAERRRWKRPIADHLPPGRILEGSTGFSVVSELSKYLETRLEEHVRENDAFALFAGMRQLSQRLWAHLGPGSYDISIARRNVADLALHRYGNWPEIDYRAPMPEWSQQSVARLVRLLVLAEAYADVLATRRRIGKGQQVVATGIPGQLFTHADQNSEEARLVRVRDERTRNNPNLLGAYASFEDAGDEFDSAGRIIAADYLHPAQIKSRYEDMANTPPELRSIASPIIEQVTCWGYLPDLADTRSRLTVFDEALRTTHGFGLLAIECALEIASTTVMRSWTTSSTLAWHGFALAPRLSDDQVSVAFGNDGVAADERWATTSAAEVISAIDYLDSSKHVAALDNPIAGRPLRMIGETMLYDAVHARLPNALFWDLALTPSLQQRYAFEFEHATHRALSEFGDQPWSRGKVIKENSVQITDVDASVAINDVLVVVDCYASLWTPALDRGSHRQNRNRSDHLVKKFRAWRDKWQQIIEQHPDCLPPGVRAVFPVVVTPGAEWISSNDRDLWITSDLPRACTVHELTGLLSTDDWMTLVTPLSIV